MDSVIEDVGQSATHQFDAAREPVAQVLDSAGAALRGIDNEFAHKSAKALGSAAGYLRTKDLKAMVADVESAARQNPMGAIVSAAAVGLLLGVLLRRR